VPPPSAVYNALLQCRFRAVERSKTEQPEASEEEDEEDDGEEEEDDGEEEEEEEEDAVDDVDADYDGDDQ
jgi:hypothetical protein